MEQALTDEIIKDENFIREAIPGWQIHLSKLHRGLRGRLLCDGQKLYLESDVYVRPQTMSDIFISYASGDRDRILPLVKALEKTGRSVFWDRTIPTGKTWREVLDSELRQSRSVLVVWTKNSVASEWVHEEAEAGKRRKILIPVLLDMVEPPLGFGTIQAASLTAWNGDISSADFARLAADIATILGPSSVEVLVDQSGFDKRQRKPITEMASADDKLIHDKSKGIDVMRRDKEHSGIVQMTIPKIMLTVILAAFAGSLIALAATGKLLPRLGRNDIAPAGGNVPAVLYAPHVYYRSAPIDPPAERCMQKAMNGLGAAGLTGHTRQEYLAWGYRQQTTGLIWCNTDYKVVIFLAAGVNAAEAEQVVETLRRSF
jgi:hypothetical protein